MLLIIYIFFFGTWFFLNVKKNGFNSGSYIISLYLISAISSIILINISNYYDVNRINIFAIFTHIFCLFLFLFPIVKISNKNLNLFKFVDFKYLRLLLYFIIILSIFTLLSSYQTVSKAFSVGDVMQARHMYNQREIDISSGGVIGYLGGIGNHLAFYALFFAFYLLVKFPQKKILILLLFLCSFSNILYNLGAMGRDGMVRWALFLLFNYFFFKKYISKSLHKKILFLSIIPLIIIGFVFYFISSARFGNREEGTMYYLLDYIGQENIYFSYIFDPFFDGIGDGRMNFGFFLGDKMSINNLNDVVYADFHLNTFSTFIGSFYLDLGFFRTIYLSIFFFIAVSFLFYKKRLAFYKIIIFLILCEIIMLGLFYYMFYPPTKIKILLIFTIFSVFITYLQRHKNFRQQ